MADPIGPISDTYVDGIVKASNVYNPNLNLTQGVKLRELLKLMRDRSEQQSGDALDEIAQEILDRESADTDITSQLTGKVDKETGFGLSAESFSSAEKTKLAALNEHYKGMYVSEAALALANPTSLPGDYAFVDDGSTTVAKMYIWDSNTTSWLLSGGTGDIQNATETNVGILAIATLAQALAGTNDTNAMTALKTLSVILDQKKNVNYQIAPVSLNEVSVLMANSGQVNGIDIAGAANAKLKVGLTGTYPSGTQSFPFPYTAGDRLFVTFQYTDLNYASCNIILTCRDN